jgi:hypothetical protein
MSPALWWKVVDQCYEGKKSDVNLGFLVKFTHPEGPSPFFHRPQKGWHRKHTESNTTTDNRARKIQ